MSNICVFCGSSSGTSPAFAEVAAELGGALAARGHRLIFGGGHVGLMGIVADAMLGAGGLVTGVMTEQLVAAEVAHEGLSELHITADMHSRKARMAELADGVVVLPGGFGTYDEAFEILTWNQLGLVSMPVAFLNVDGFYDPLFELVERAVAAGFVKPVQGALVQRADDVDAAIDVATGPVPAHVRKWVD